MSAPKLSHEQRLEIRRRRKAGEKNADLAREFGVSASRIHAIANAPLMPGKPGRPEKRAERQAEDDWEDFFSVDQEFDRYELGMEAGKYG